MIELTVIDLNKDTAEKYNRMLLEAQLLESEMRLFNAAKKNEKGRWITTEKGQRVFIPEGANVKETVEKAIEKRRDKSTPKKLTEEQMTDKAYEEGVKKLGHDELMKRSHEKIDELKISDQGKRKLHDMLDNAYGKKDKSKENATLNEMTFNQEFNRLLGDIEEEKNREGKSMTLGGYQDLRLELMKKTFDSLGKEKSLDHKKLRKDLRKYYDELEGDKFFKETGKEEITFQDLKNERRKTRKLLDESLEKMDEKTLEKKLMKNIDNWENMSDDERKYTFERIKEMFRKKPTYKGPEIPQWSKFNESLEREKKLRNQQRKDEGKPPMNKKEEAELHVNLFEVWEDKIKSYEPKPKRRSPEIEKFEKELSELSKKKRGYMNDEEYFGVRYIEAVLQDKTPRAVELARKRIEKMDVSEEFKRKLRKRLDGS